MKKIEMNFYKSLTICFVKSVTIIFTSSFVVNNVLSFKLIDTFYGTKLSFIFSLQPGWARSEY